MRNDPLIWRRRMAQAIRDGWSRWRARRSGAAELAACSSTELGRKASEFGLSAGELRYLAATGSGTTGLLNKRLRALDIAPLEIAAVPGLKPALDRCCFMCDSKSECARDLRTDPHSASWEQYCPNEATLSALAALKSH